MGIVTFYRDAKKAPKTTMPTRLGANVIITCGNKILLEKRSDCDAWGLVGGGVKRYETAQQAMVREIYEELGLRVAASRLTKLAVYGEPGRVAAYRDGSIWRMVIVVFSLEMEHIPEMKISAESKELRFFTKEELKEIEVIVTHSDIVEDLFLNR